MDGKNRASLNQLFFFSLLNAHHFVSVALCSTSLIPKKSLKNQPKQKQPPTHTKIGAKQTRASFPLLAMFAVDSFKFSSDLLARYKLLLVLFHLCDT